RGMLPILAAGGGYCALIIAEPNMSVTVVTAAVTFAMLFLSGAKLKYFLMLAVPALLAIPVLIIAEPYRLLRLNAFIDPWSSPKEEGYQLIQSLYALGNGGWFGTGLFKSRQKYRFLPFAESDFILAVIGEETGFFGILLLFSAFAFLIFRGIKTSVQANDFFSFLLALGITLTYGLQTLVNALVVSGSIPPTGIPLPLVSSGNTSLIVTMASFGVLYRISRSNKKDAAFIQ
ncbi:MAG: FtsW/RodA/SpoVE family cell cycle protein, partial [Candidatus Scatosoma sp.]